MNPSRSSSARLRRTWPQRLLLTFSVFLISTALIAAAGLGYFYLKYSQIERVALAGVLDRPGAGGVAVGAQNFLLVGSDTRDNVDPDSPDYGIIQDGSVSGQRADTIMILRVDPRSERAAMISLPRDLAVEIGESGRRNKINSAFQDGPESLIRTIQRNFNIPIHHYIEVDFVGFKALVEAVDGVPMYFPAPTRDRGSGLDIDDAGCHVLDGQQALAFVRARNYQELVDGNWRADPTGDLGRISRQQVFIGRVIRRAISKGVRDVTKLNALINVGIDNVALDDQLSARNLLDLGREFRTADPDDIAMYRLPVSDGNLGGASVLIARTEQAEPVLDIFRGLRTIDGREVPVGDQEDQGAGRNIQLASEVQVRILNGGGVTGQAAAVANALQSVGFGISGVSNADSQAYATTQIRHTAENRPEAEFLARWLESGAELVQVDAVNGADVVLLIGRDFSAVYDTPLAEPQITESTTPDTTPETTVPAEETTTTTVVGVVPDQTATEAPCG